MLSQSLKYDPGGFETFLTNNMKSTIKINKSL